MRKKNIPSFKTHPQRLRAISEQEKLFWLREGETFFQAFKAHFAGQHYHKAAYALYEATACYYTALVLARLYEQKQQAEQLLSLLKELSAQPREVICPHALAALAQCVALFRGLSALSCEAPLGSSFLGAGKISGNSP